MPGSSLPRAYAVRRSGIHGRGVFATRTIRKGTTIIEYRGQRTTWEIASQRETPGADDPHHTFIFGLDDGTVIDAGVRGNAARWINHGCEPNCEAIEYDDRRVFIHARRTIRAGEELTYDYRLSFVGPISRRAREALRCHCGAKRCRGTLLLKPPARPKSQARPR